MNNQKRIKEIAYSPIIIDESICRGCEICLLACSLSHTGQCNPSLARLRVKRELDRYAFKIEICLHCEAAACVEACPTDAIIHDAQGRVILLVDDCILCGACQTECPYEAIYLDPQSGMYYKCDLCQDRVEGPRCIESCPTGALSFRNVSLGG